MAHWENPLWILRAERGLHYIDDSEYHVRIKSDSVTLDPSVTRLAKKLSRKYVTFSVTSVSQQY